MKFTCSRQDLLDAATNVQRAVSTKSNIPALEGILIKAQGETLSLSGYDLEIGIITSIPAVIEEEDELIVSARLFGDIIRKLNSDTVCLSGDATNVITLFQYNLGFRYYQFGTSAALSILIMLITSLIIVLYIKVSNYKI